MEDCQSKCCEFPACDLAFMLAGSCYLVGCYDQKNCAMQPAKESKFQPQISYVTRWNAEGVKHTVLLQEKGVQYVCPKMQPLTKVTLKDGLQAGDFTDVGKVSNLGQCYDVCCQQEKCDLAFMLGQNCFSVQCKDKALCVTTPAQPSIFNPQIAYIMKRDREEVSPKLAIEKLSNHPTNATAVCPKTNVLDKMTLKGGVEAGVYKDHGVVKNMDLCRHICCEMTECHLAFMLGQNCFSVKCASVDSCRALKAKPSSYYPKISYLRNVVSNALLPNLDAKLSSINSSDHAVHGDGSKKSSPQKKVTASKQTESLKPNLLPLSVFGTTVAPAVKPNVGGTAAPVVKPNAPVTVDISKISETTTGFAVTANGLKPLKIDNPIVKDAMNGKDTADVTATATKDNKDNVNTPVSTTKDTNLVSKSDIPTAAVSKSDIPMDDNKLLLNALESNENANASSDCKPGILKSNVTLKGGRKAGEFIEIKGLSDMKSCVKRCCDDMFKKCNLAFMLGDTCYSVACKQKELCATIPAPPTKFNPLVQYVRGLEEEAVPTSKVPDPSKSVDITKADITKADITKPSDSSKVDTAKLPEESPNAPKDEDSSKDIAAKTNLESPSVVDTDDISKDSEKAKLEPINKSKKKSCISQPIVTAKSIQGGKKAGKFKIFRDIRDMGTCINKCCSLKKQCDVAYMEDNKCFSILCFKKSACSAIDLRDSDVNPRFAYMDHYLEKVEQEEADGDITTDLEADDSACMNVEVTKNKTLKGGMRAGKFHSTGKKDMRKCIGDCCGRPNCDIAYQLNGHCYSVECADGKLCQATNEPSRDGDNIQLAYMNKSGLNEKQRDYMVIYIIVGSLAFAATLGGLIWLVFAISKRKKMKKPPHKRLLDDEEEEEPIDDLLQKRQFNYRSRR